MLIAVLAKVSVAVVALLPKEETPVPTHDLDLSPPVHRLNPKEPPVSIDKGVIVSRQEIPAVQPLNPSLVETREDNINGLRERNRHGNREERQAHVAKKSKKKKGKNGSDQLSKLFSNLG